MNGEQNQKEPKTELIVTVSIILTALIIGGGVYVWQRNDKNTAVNDLEDEISSLQKQVTELKNNDKESSKMDEKADDDDGDASQDKNDDKMTDDEDSPPVNYTQFVIFDFMFKYPSDTWDHELIHYRTPAEEAENKPLYPVGAVLTKLSDPNQKIYVGGNQTSCASENAKRCSENPYPPIYTDSTDQEAISVYEHMVETVIKCTTEC